MVSLPPCSRCAGRKNQTHIGSFLAAAARPVGGSRSCSPRRCCRRKRTSRRRRRTCGNASARPGGRCAHATCAFFIFTAVVAIDDSQCSAAGRGLYGLPLWGPRSPWLSARVDQLSMLGRVAAGEGCVGLEVGAADVRRCGPVALRARRDMCAPPRFEDFCARLPFSLRIWPLWEAEMPPDSRPAAACLASVP